MGLSIFMQTAISNSTGCCLYGWIASGNTESYVTSQIISLSFFHMQLVCSYSCSNIPLLSSPGDLTS